MMRSPLRLGLLVLLVTHGCDGSARARSTLAGWPPGEPVVAGTCSFVLVQADLYHSTEWHLDVEIRGENIGAEAARCSFSARAMTSSDTKLTDAAKGGQELAPGEGFVREVSSRETDTTGMSSGAQEGAWVYVELQQGRWPMAKTTAVQVTPQRVRPPG
ncbi:MAG: hypothetical protein AB1Z98_27100 [Nannocystaceae bacterium]